MTRWAVTPDATGSPFGNPYCDWYFGAGAHCSLTKRLLTPAVGDFVSMLDVAGTTVTLQRAMPNAPTAAGVQRFPSLLRADALPHPASATSEVLDFSTPPVSGLKYLSNMPEAERDQIVIVAVIDDGINVANARFVDENGESRVDFAWIQDARAKGQVPFGAELQKADIDTARGKSVDSTLQMQELGLIEASCPERMTLNRSVTHGTHIADLAAGYGSADADRQRFMASNLRRIIAVQLPFLMTAETSGAFALPFVTLAVQYILDRAELIRAELGLPKIPVVINFSYANSMGPHDGSGDLETMFDSLLGAANSNIDAHLVLPAGNRFQGRLYAELSSTNTALPWRIQPEDQTPSFLEIWWPKTSTSVDLAITAPDGEVFTAPVDGVPVLILRHGQVVGRITRTNFSAKTRVLIAFAPTSGLPAGEATLLSGVWSIKLSPKPALGANQKIRAWIQRDDTIYRFRTNARQSYFDDPAYERFDALGYLSEADNGSFVKRRGSISGMATVRGSVAGRKPFVTVVGGAREERRRGKPEPDTISGQGFQGSGAQTDVLAVSDRSAVTPGVIASGTQSGAHGVLNGTSVAAPQIARVIADTLADAAKNGQPLRPRNAADQLQGPQVKSKRLGSARVQKKFKDGLTRKKRNA